MKYKTVKNESRSELIVKKSKFTANIKPVLTAKEAEDFIFSIKNENKTARHNVYAYKIFSGDLKRYSDDGEPKGTAGNAIFSILEKEEIYDIVVVVTRYFGGILLGKGGLVSAYTESFKAALDLAEKTMANEYVKFLCSFDYSSYERIKSSEIFSSIIVININYGDHINAEMAVLSEIADSFRETIEKICGKELKIVEHGKLFIKH